MGIKRRYFVRSPTTTPAGEVEDQPRSGLALVDRRDTTWPNREGVAFYDRVGSTLPGMMMVCLVTAAAEKRSRAPPGNIAYNYVHRREDTHALWMRYAHTVVRYPPVNHVTGLVNSANDLRRCVPRRLPNLFFSLVPISFSLSRLHFCIAMKEKRRMCKIT